MSQWLYRLRHHEQNPEQVNKDKLFTFYFIFFFFCTNTKRFFLNMLSQYLAESTCTMHPPPACVSGYKFPDLPFSSMLFICQVFALCWQDDVLSNSLTGYSDYIRMALNHTALQFIESTSGIYYYAYYALSLSCLNCAAIFHFQLLSFYRFAHKLKKKSFNTVLACNIISNLGKY